MSNDELKLFILQTSERELMSLLQVVSSAKLHELEAAIRQILVLMN